MDKKRTPRQRLTREAREAVADSQWWKELTRYLPWRLHSFTGRSHAAFLTGSVTMMSGANDDALLYNALVVPRIKQNQAQMLELTGEQRNHILAAIVKQGVRRK